MPNEQQANLPTPDLFDSDKAPATDAAAKPKARRAPRKTAAAEAGASLPEAAAVPDAAAPAPRKRKPKAVAEAAGTAEAEVPAVPRKKKVKADAGDEAATVGLGASGRRARSAARAAAGEVAAVAAPVVEQAEPAAPKPARKRSRTASAPVADGAPSVPASPAPVAAVEPRVRVDAEAPRAPVAAEPPRAETEAVRERPPRAPRREPVAPAVPAAVAEAAVQPSGERPPRDPAAQPGRDEPNGQRGPRSRRNRSRGAGNAQAPGNAQVEANGATDADAQPRTPAGQPQGGQPQRADGTPGSSKRRRKPRDRRGKREGRIDGAPAADTPTAVRSAGIPDFIDDDDEDDDFYPQGRATYADSQQIAKAQRDYFAAEALIDEDLDDDEVLKEIAAFRPRDRQLGNGAAKGTAPEDFPRMAREEAASVFEPPAGRAAIEHIDALAPKLQKVLAEAGIGSRREMEELILAGRVSVNGEPAHIGQRVEIADQVRVNGKPLQRRNIAKPPRVIIYHKPSGEIVSNDDPEKRATVFERLPQVKNGRWVSVGRLDFNTEGLLIFTTSGELANRLMHPRFGQEREYAVRCLPELTPEARRALIDGVVLDDGPAKVNGLMDAGGDGVNHWYHVTISEGRNREVRRLFETVGATVSRLIRVRYGEIELPRGLKRGRWTEASPMEAAFLCARLGIKLAGDAPHKGGGKQQRGGQQHKPREISPLDTMTEAMFGVSPVKGERSDLLTTHVLSARQNGGGQGQQQRRRGGIPGMPGMDGPPDGRPAGAPRGPKPGFPGGARGPQGKKAGGGFGSGNGKPGGAKFGGKPGAGKKPGKPGGVPGTVKAQAGPKPGGKPGGRPGGGKPNGPKGPRGPKL
ncbi:pseudouridine synthase [Derxia lacustris]|uniref:pseudouridine synthase n=1 Tax=Derxia lacustris TaxID=764842 RepID=UPI001F321DFE|nr:pseudouridine synthase [Derxia lacustris]